MTPTATNTAAKSPVAQKPNADPTIAIAFGGGGARGYAHIHIMQVLDELGIKPVAISGASIGAIMGAAYASGMSGAQINDYVMGLMNKRTDILAKLWQTRPAKLSQLIDGGFRFGQFNIERVLGAFLPEQTAKTFEDLQTPLSVVVTDYYGHTQKFIDHGDLYSAIAASAAIPAIFKPVLRDDRFYVDGGVFNPVPYDPLVGKADIVIGVDVVGVPEGDPAKSPTTIESLYGVSQLMMQSIMQLKIANSPPDIYVRPPVSSFRVMDFFKAKQILEKTHSIQEDFKRQLDGAIEAYHVDPTRRSAQS